MQLSECFPSLMTRMHFSRCSVVRGTLTLSSYPKEPVSVQGVCRGLESPLCLAAGLSLEPPGPLFGEARSVRASQPAVKVSRAMAGVCCAPVLRSLHPSATTSACKPSVSGRTWPRTALHQGTRCTRVGQPRWTPHNTSVRSEPGAERFGGRRRVSASSGADEGSTDSGRTGGGAKVRPRSHGTSRRLGVAFGVCMMAKP
jgi:hypothetical protein